MNGNPRSASPFSSYRFDNAQRLGFHAIRRVDVRVLPFQREKGVYTGTAPDFETMSTAVVRSFTNRTVQEIDELRSTILLNVRYRLLLGSHLSSNSFS